MSNYGPPEGGYPGQPADPWHEADPWATPPAGPHPGAAPYGQHSGNPYEQGYQTSPYLGDPQQPVWSPSPPQKKGMSGALIGVIAAVAVILIGGAAVGVYLLTSSGKTGTTATNSQSPAGTGTGTRTPTAGASSAPSTPASFTSAKEGDCLVNNGTDSKPDLQITSCDSGSYEVVKRFDGPASKATANQKCSTLNDSGNLSAFYYHTPTGQGDFVLCLKRH